MSPLAAILFIFFLRPCASFSQESGDSGSPLQGIVREKLIPQSPKESETQMALAGAGGFNSVLRLLPTSFKMARQWSPGAALYSMTGWVPRNEKMLEPETWLLTFGDSETGDGRFRAEFKDESLASREGIKNKVQMTEFFKDGNFQSRKSARIRWKSSDYENCMPVDHEFLDSRDLEKTIRMNKFPDGLKNQFRITLFHPLNEKCDGLGHLSELLTEKPVPKKLLDQTLWVVSNNDEVLYLDARTGKILERRKRRLASSDED